MRPGATLSVLATTVFVVVVTVAVFAGLIYVVREFPYIGVPLLLILVILGWWRIYDNLMRKAEGAYRRQKRERSDDGQQ